MFMKIHDDFINLDNVCLMHVSFHTSYGDDMLEHVGEDEIYTFYLCDTFNIKLEIQFIAGIRTYEFSMLPFYTNCYVKLKDSIDEGERTNYSRALRSICNHEEMKVKILKEINKYKSSGAIVALDLEVAISNYYKTFLDE